MEGIRSVNGEHSLLHLTLTVHNEVCKQERNLCCVMKLRIFFSLSFLGLHLWHMEVPRLGVKLELQLPAYTATTVAPDPSSICDLHHTAHSNAGSLTH